LQKKGDIVLKEVGASKVYLFNQAHFPEVDKVEMEQLGKDLDEKNDQLKYFTQENNKLNETIKQLSKIMKINEIENEI
jgi:septal ring factor EnvC (AmiA/AmiB activator)